ncbi:DUF3040 domain-containing protein [Streptomyces sp. NPDC056149]|uniref:DUF3040 domain-containing protein n=1 Tax=unclassified Streptomyces TaxID=2593676 RepID=UPI00238112E0|nr:DUF3040 domain-containing protein [Streptomyces sp. WZ-12]
MTEALSRRELFLLAQIEQDLSAEDAALDRRLTAMCWDAPGPQPSSATRLDGEPGAAHSVGAMFRGLLAKAGTAVAAAMVSVCASVWGLALACLARLVCRWSRPRNAHAWGPGD